MPWNYHCGHIPLPAEDAPRDEVASWHEEYTLARKEAVRNLETVIGAAILNYDRKSVNLCFACEEHYADLYAGLYELIQSLPQDRRERWYGLLQDSLVP